MSAPEFSPPDAIVWGWRKFTQFLGPVMIGVAIYIACNAPFTLVTTGLDIAAESSPDNVALQLIDGIGGLVLQIVSTIGGWILVGAAVRASLDVADGRQYDFLSAIRRIPIGKLIVLPLLIGLVAVVALALVGGVGFLAGYFLHVPIWILAVLGALILIPSALAAGVFLYFARWVLVDEPTTGIVDAIGMSIRLARANLGNTVLLALLNALVMIGGLLACCIGLIVAFPVTMFATASAYRTFRGQPVAP
ncbi:MAG: hypothetical protein ACJ71Z_11715 [Aeromicrobium sp.]